MDVNEGTEMFSAALADLVNNSGLPIVNVELVLERTLREVVAVKERALKEARAQREQNRNVEAVENAENQKKTSKKKAS